MAGKKTSIARHITYTHVPKDGKTPVYNSASKTWDYMTAPTDLQLTSSATQLKTIDLRSANAVEKADAAKEVADTKATAEEAVEKVKKSLFFISRNAHNQPAGVIGGNPLRLELLEDDMERWSFRVHAMRGASTGDTNIYALPLDYIRREEFIEVLERLVAIEKKLGIM